MCKDCGCLTATHPVFSHSHSHSHGHDHAHTHTHESSSASLTRRIHVEENLFMQNQRFAAENRQFFSQLKLTVFNFMSSPGSGKTALLSAVLPLLQKQHPLAVVVGDQETDMDAARLRKAGLMSFQINTHSACHLDAHRVRHAVEQLPLQELEWLIIENVGNLVCPAVFDLGETFKVALLSTTEGEEKPLKYPVLFHDADLVVVTKSDLVPYLDFDSRLLLHNIRTLNPTAAVVFCSVKSGEGIAEVAAALENLAPTRGLTHVPGHPSTDTHA